MSCFVLNFGTLEPTLTKTVRWRPGCGHRRESWHQFHPVLCSPNSHQGQRRKRRSLSRRKCHDSLARSNPVTQRLMGGTERAVQYHSSSGWSKNELLLGQSCLPLPDFQIAFCSTRVASEEGQRKENQISSHVEERLGRRSKYDEFLFFSYASFP